MARAALNIDDRRHMPMSERMLLVESDQSNHIEECTARWNLLIKIMMWGGGGVAGTIAIIIIGAGGWAFSTLHADQERQNALFTQYIQTPPKVVIGSAP